MHLRRKAGCIYSIEVLALTGAGRIIVLQNQRAARGSALAGVKPLQGSMW